MHATDYVRPLWNIIHMFLMIRIGTTLILGHGLKVKVSYDTLSVKPYWPEKN